MKTYTWDDIYERAIDKPCMHRDLRAKDEARWQVRNLIIENGEDDPDLDEIPEDTIEDYCKVNDIKFDEDGNII